MEAHLDSLGLDTSSLAARARSQSRGRPTMRSSTDAGDMMDIDASGDPREAALLRAKSRARSQSNRREDGVTSLGARSKADKLAKLGQQKMNRMARQGEADRHTSSAMPKHLVSRLFVHQYHSLSLHEPVLGETWYG